MVKFDNIVDRNAILRNRKNLKRTGLAITEELTKNRLNLLKEAQEMFD